MKPLSFHDYACHLCAVNPQEEKPNLQSLPYKHYIISAAFIHTSQPPPKPPHYHNSGTAKPSCTHCGHSYTCTLINDELFLTLWKWNCAPCTAQIGELNGHPLLCMFSVDGEACMDCVWGTLDALATKVELSQPAATSLVNRMYTSGRHSLTQTVQSTEHKQIPVPLNTSRTQTQINAIQCHKATHAAFPRPQILMTDVQDPTTLVRFIWTAGECLDKEITSERPAICNTYWLFHQNSVISHPQQYTVTAMII
jgi:hypothetical protein